MSKPTSAQAASGGVGEPLTPGQRFEALARRILTTPKAELVKPGDAKWVLASKPGGKNRNAKKRGN